MFHAETRRRLVRRIPAEGLDPCGYGIDAFHLASRHLIVVCTQTYIFRCCIVFEVVVCRLYEMLYPCICNVVISCWKSGAYGFVICRGGTDMCFVLGFGRKRPNLKQYCISGLTPSPRVWVDPSPPSRGRTRALPVMPLSQEGGSDVSTSLVASPPSKSPRA